MKFPFLKTNNIKILPMVGGPNGEEIKYICYAGDVENVLFHGCKYLNEEKDMPQQFPLIEKWMPGLRLARLVGVIDTADGHPTQHVFAAEDIEAELAKGLEVKTSDENSWNEYMPAYGEIFTHEALLIGARPIKQETAEEKLKAEVDKAVTKAICHINGATLADQQRALEMVQEVFNPFLARSKA